MTCACVCLQIFLLHLVTSIVYFVWRKIWCLYAVTLCSVRKKQGIKIQLYWDAAPCWLVNSYSDFEGLQCLRPWGLRCLRPWVQEVQEEWTAWPWLSHVLNCLTLEMKALFSLEISVLTIQHNVTSRRLEHSAIPLWKSQILWSMGCL